MKREKHSSRHLVLHGGDACADELRQVLDTIAAALDFAPGASFQLQVAASETLTSALAQGAGEDVEVAVRATARGVEVEVWSCARFVVDDPHLSQLVDQIDLDVSPDGTLVRLRKRA